MVLTLTVILFAYFIHGLTGHAIPQSPIVGITGGHPVDIEDVPFMAALLQVRPRSNMTGFTCGGSIIHEQFVLTAAHCIKFRMFPIAVRVGSSLPNEKGKLYEVETYIIHDQFHGEYKDVGYDIGLLKLSQPLTFGPKVAAIKVAGEGVGIQPGLTANVTGWGHTSKSWKFNQTLEQVSVRVSPPEVCNYKYHDADIKITDKLQICSSIDGKGFCNGDSGGPLTADGYQIGIVSGGSACYGYPNIYVKVPAFSQWINDKITENLNREH